MFDTVNITFLDIMWCFWLCIISNWW